MPRPGSLSQLARGSSCPVISGRSDARSHPPPQVKVMLRIWPVQGAQHSAESTAFLKVDPRKKQVTLYDPAAGPPGSSGPQRATTAAAPKMFAFDAVFPQDSEQVRVAASTGNCGPGLPVPTLGSELRLLLVLGKEGARGEAQAREGRAWGPGRPIRFPLPHGPPGLRAPCLALGLVFRLRFPGKHPVSGATLHGSFWAVVYFALVVCEHLGALLGVGHTL